MPLSYTQRDVPTVYRSCATALSLPDAGFGKYLRE